jgi:hypothetical protein
VIRRTAADEGMPMPNIEPADELLDEINGLFEVT